MDCPADCMVCRDSLNCITCQPGWIIDSVTRSCAECKIENYEKVVKDGICYPCHTDCKKCITEKVNSCLWCASNKIPNYNLGCQSTSSSRMEVALSEFDPKTQKVKIVLNTKYRVVNIKKAFKVILMDSEATSTGGK